MVLDYFVSFCDDGNCKPHSPYRCEYPQIKLAHANLLNKEDVDWTQEEYCKVLLFQLEAFDKFHRFKEGTWTVRFVLNGKYTFEYSEDYWMDSDYLNHEYDITEMKIPVQEFENGIDISCELLLNNEIVCPMLVDVVITTGG